ncbi:MAG TPA: hypothetical protein P5256_09590 [Beijerinckiaceae bacterium]|nr:hypothetical protein [Rhodoblastus sp.]HPG02074.1 hypothetical protein [Rhodoblastus sp.]HRY03370.1 hypothetical protein [Beijerinckiaceae bacterium]
MRLAIILLAAAAVAAGPAAAKPKHRKAVRTYESTRPVAGFCQPMCSFDMTPCDPPEYKRADGRCASPLVGGTQMF